MPERRSTRLLRDWLDRRPWAARTQDFDALGFRFRVRADDAALVAHLDDVLASLAAGRPGGDVHTYSVFDRGERWHRRYGVYRDVHRIGVSPHPQWVLELLLWDVNRAAVETAGRGAVVVHAGAVARDGAVVLLPGRSGAGKSTLTAACVGAGLDYVTDEAVAVDVVTGAVRGLAKPITLKVGSWPLLPQLRPDRAGSEPWWLVRPDRAGGATAAGGHVHAVVVPTLGDATRLAPITTGQAVQALARHAFRSTLTDARRLEALAAAVRGRPCYHLTVGDLGTAAAAVLGVVDPTTERRHAC